ncbi:MAG: cytochrome P450 [Chloroflexota bacterium]
MTVQDMQLTHIGLENDDFAEGVPHETFRLLRREAPIYWYEWKLGRAFWCITRHSDLVTTHRDTETFSSEIGATALEDLDPEQIEARKSMLDTDPPRHTRLRALVTKDFTPRALSAYEMLLRELSREIIDRASHHSELDFVQEIAAVLPIRVLAQILGVPDADTPQLIEWSDRMIGNTDPDFADVLLDSPESEEYRLLPFRSPAALEVFEYGHRMGEDRRKHPKDDIVSKLVQAEIDGDRLTEREFDTIFLLLVVAGNETTRQAIAHGMRALIEHPDQMESMRERRQDVTFMKTATEEIVRWATPVMHFRRTATRDVEMRGILIRAGDKVVTWYISANHDEEVFVEPFRFDLSRRPNDHVSFGKGGPHHCLGAHLARLEIRIMFEELLPRMADVGMLSEPERMRSNFTNAIKRMPVRVRWAELP